MCIRKPTLRTLLIFLSVGGIVITSTMLLSALMLFQKGNIESSLLEENIAYARKLADTTDRYLRTAQKELAWSASEIHSISDTASVQKEVNRLRLQSGFFNSVVMVSAQAVVTATSPESLNLTGTQLHSAVSARAIRTQQAFISDPYISVSGNDVVFISHPVFSGSGQYLGYIGGSIYLKKQSMLSELLNRHFYADSTDISIISADGSVIFNEDPDKVGTKMTLPAEVQKTLAGTHSGSFRMNSHGSGYLTGFAGMQENGWHILISGSSDRVSQMLHRTVISAAWFILLILILTGAGVALFSAQISRPLEKLAELTCQSDCDVARKAIPDINAWYREAESLKKATVNYILQMSSRVAALDNEASTDPLTGLLNRRGFGYAIKNYQTEEQHCVIALDIDHFKRINDEYGHETGDTVLVHIAGIITASCRSGDIVGRPGGEEFTVFLPDTDPGEACVVAERIRLSVANAVFPLAGHVTISGGVAALNECENDYDKMLRQADTALYEAKRSGRNAVIASHSGKLTRIELQNTG
ncbi:sensor domain-containing diguanylate cyclase [Citrobacter portucalensis]|uniref:sensor domain-containing diguanylate cyclase n=1 Tax=Citrobacter portucalensis TaxID=1639133 RepID=UPI003C2BEA52